MNEMTERGDHDNPNTELFFVTLKKNISKFMTHSEIEHDLFICFD